MIVGIVQIASGIVPLEEFRIAASAVAGRDAFCAAHTPPLDTADYLGINSGWTDPDPRTLLCWAWNFDTSALVRDLVDFQADLVVQIKDSRAERLADVVRFEHPAASGKFFSCSRISQDNWGNLAILDQLGLVTYTFAVTTWDEMDSHDLADSADLSTAIGSLSSAVLTERATAASAIAAVFAAVDVTAAQAAAAAYP